MRQVSIDELAEALTHGAQLIDVREHDEYARGHVPGAVAVPMGELPSRLDELDRSREVHLVCRSGNRSGAMADLLTGQGFTAINVVGGTDAWIASGRPVEGPLPLTVHTLETPSLGDRSYLVHDGRVALVVDPQRDIDRVLDLLAADGVRLTHVFETHIHNDYVTGGFALAAATGADYLVNAEDEVSFQRTGIRDGDVIDVSDRMRVTVLATPGHTFTHLSYALSDPASGTSVGAFTGGSLLYGATGRPDLLGAEHAEELARHQHASARRLAELPDDTGVFPTHGFGSFCSATQSTSADSTIGDERRTNPVLTSDEETYVAELLAGLGAYPTYYAHMAPANSAGPDAPDLSLPRTADAEELRQRIEAGEWVVDLRHRTAFAAGHTRGALNFGIDGPFATYLGWLIEWGTPLTLLGESVEQVAEAQRELVRIGIDRPAAHATGGPSDWSTEPLASFATATFADLAQVRSHREVVVVDVRRTDEHAASRIPGSVNVPLHDLVRHLGEVPPGEVWVHCAAGYRASVGASVLSAAGRHVVAIDDAYDSAVSLGLTTDSADRAGA